MTNLDDILTVLDSVETLRETYESEQELLATYLNPFEKAMKELQSAIYYRLELDGAMNDGQPSDTTNALTEMAKDLNAILLEDQLRYRQLTLVLDRVS